MNSGDDDIVLHEDEVPGASLRGRDVGSLKIPELNVGYSVEGHPQKG